VRSPRLQLVGEFSRAARALRVVACLTAGCFLSVLGATPAATADLTDPPISATPSASPPTPTSPPVTTDAATPTPGQQGSASATEDNEADDEPSVVVMPTCVSQDQAAGEAEVHTNLWGLDGRRFEWTLEYGGEVITRETFVWSDEEEGGPHWLGDLSPGGYSLKITLLDEARVIAAAKFEILRCVTTHVGCRTVTFLNPVGNPALKIDYGAGMDASEGDDEDVDDGRRIDVPPGESPTVDTLRSSFGWSATRVLDPGQPPSFGGEAYDVEVPQHCGDTMTRSVVGCASSRGAVVDMWFSPPDGRRAKFKIIDFHEVVKSGSVTGTDGHLRIRLPASSYELRAYTSAAVLPYERVRFDVVPCLQTRLTCTGATFTNPAEFPDYTVVYTFGSNPSTSIRLGSKKSKKVSTSAKSMRWEALPRFEELPELWTIHAGEGKAKLPTDCADVRDDQNGLADTGGPGPVPAVTALLLLSSSVLLAGHRKRLIRGHSENFTGRALS